MRIRMPHDALVVLVGPSGSGKTTWAERAFEPSSVVSSDRLRALVGEAPHDRAAGTDAFAVLDLVLDRRLRRGLFTVVDSLGLDDARRRDWTALARRHGRPVHLVGFDAPPALCRRRNRSRERGVPAGVLTSQLDAWQRLRGRLEAEGADAVHLLRIDDDGPRGRVTLVPPELIDAPQAADRQKESPMALRFGLQIARFSWTGGPAETAARLGAIAGAAERVGFDSLWVMDHLVQIPQVGREWEDMLDATTASAWLAARTERCRIGVLVQGITYRDPARVAKIAATLDVLSGGRAVCGLGAAWYEREHALFDVPFPKASERYALLEDALELLPLMWGKGTPAYEGRRVRVPAAICYPRPLQERLPMLVGGQGEDRTLALVARHADACNLFGSPETVRHKLAVLGQHCEREGRDPASIEVTHLSTALVAGEDDEVAARLAALHPDPVGRRRFAERVHAGSVADQIGRYRLLAEAGVDTAIVSLADLDDTAQVEAFAPVVAAFAST
jgi:F420-dependent oxidoreductase-like protein